MNGRICGFCLISFMCSINQFLEYRHLTKVIHCSKVFDNFTFVLQRISKWKFLIIFCHTEVLFPRHSNKESNRTHIFLKQAIQSVQKTFFYKYSEKKFQESKYSSPRSTQYFRKKMFVMEFVLFSIMLRASPTSSVFSSVTRLLLLCKRSNIA